MGIRDPHNAVPTLDQSHTKDRMGMCQVNGFTSTYNCVYGSLFSIFRNFTTLACVLSVIVPERDGRRDECATEDLRMSHYICPIALKRIVINQIQA